jgi:hypothetical protein
MSSVHQAAGGAHHEVEFHLAAVLSRASPVARIAVTMRRALVPVRIRSSC